MNKLLLPATIACVLLLLDIPEAAAHDRDHGYSKKHYSYPVVREHQGYRHGYHARKPVRSTKMPKWLKRDKSFRHWFEHSHLRRDRQLSWSQLFDIYRWEHSHYRYRRY